jgi:regulator of sigma E protease
MEWFALGIPTFFLVVIPLILFHELGHYWAARYFGVGVEAFSIGFGPELIGFNDRSGTRWRLSLIPLGGYVRMFGDSNAASAPGRHDDDMPEELRALSLHHKPVWQRAIVVAAGPAANFILALALFAAVFIGHGRTEFDPIVGSVVEGSPAERAGLQVGDRVLSFGAYEIQHFQDISRAVNLSRRQTSLMRVARDGAEVSLSLAPEQDQTSGQIFTRYIIGMRPFYPLLISTVPEDSLGQAMGLKPGDYLRAIDGKGLTQVFDLLQYLEANDKPSYLLSIESQGRQFEATWQPERRLDPESGQRLYTLGFGFAAGSLRSMGPLEGLSAAASEVGRTVMDVGATFKLLFAGKLERKDFGGIVKITSVAGQIPWSWVALASFAAFISIQLGVLNLLPIPVLDGGHLVMFAYEAVVGKPLPAKVQEMAFAIGFMLIVGLALYLNIGDIFDLSQG